MTDKEFKKAELNFSFANVPDTGTIDGGKLSVRYFHNGAWKSAGEISLTKQGISNATNGGFFTQTLDDVTSWKDLKDINVVFEYTPGDGSAPVQLYLESMWIDVVFVDQVQDILSGNITDPTDAPPNVDFSLDKQASQDPTVLVRDDGSIVTFPFLDSQTDTLGVRTDRSTYNALGSSTVLYTSITNTGKNQDTFSLYTSFPGGKGTVSDVSQYLHDVPLASSTTQTSNVSYFCQGGWQTATSSTVSTCPSSRETYTCTSFNSAGDNCLVQNVTVGTATSTSYSSDWVSIDVNSSPAKDKLVDKNLPPGYKVSFITAKSFTILPGQTLYFKETIHTPDSDLVRFVVSARGQSYFGDVDSLHLRTEQTLIAQAKIKKAKPKVDNLNDQISDQSDFSVDQLPKFHFKFKTQRGFFTRLKDFLFNHQVAYKVKSATLVHASGEVEHLPVTLDYQPNGEWSLQLQKQPRDFRPGKYSINVSMSEDGAAYTDTIPFYWGVLALNTDKSSYEPGDTAHLSLAALDDKGDTLCNAQLALTITDPAGNASDVPVVSGGGCGHDNVTTLQDFVADYPVAGEGAYTMELSRLDDSGSIVTSSTGTFTVQANAPYVVTRDGPTRIFPASAYSMHITANAPQGFNGDIIETLPEGFTLGNTNGGVVTRADGVIYITWHAALNGTAPFDVSYTFKAPEVSPYMYLLGPMQLKDGSSGAIVFKEPTTWKIASDATSIATGVAWLGGNATTFGANVSSTTAAALTWNLTDDFDTTYFSHSTSTNNSQLTVKVDGDYLVAVTVPIERGDTLSTRTSLETDIRVNGGKINAGVSRAFIRTTGSPNQYNESSGHLYMLLKGLHAGDYIESYVRNLSTAVESVTIASQASLYAEYIGIDQQAYFGVATTTNNGTNLNPAASSTLIWYDDPTLGRSDSNYSHSNTGAASTTITLAAAGSYMVFVNIPLSGAVTNANPIGRVSLNGVIVNGGEFKQGYIANTSSVTDSSLQWSGVVTATTTNSALKLSLILFSTGGTLTVNNDQASIYIQQLPATGVYVSSATTSFGGTNFNPTSSSTMLWSGDTVKDAMVYTHSTTTNSQNITVLQAGDYLVSVNDSRSGGITSSNEITKIAVNSVPVSGAQTKTHFQANTTSDAQSSGSLVYLLRNMAVNDVVTVTTEQEAAPGTILEDRPALVMLWHKSAQSNFVQDTERWYDNVNAEPPTDPWPPGSTDLNEGDAISTGNAVSSGATLRVRMALKANVTTLAGADSFKLQYAPGTSCGLALAWADVGSTSSAAIWRSGHNAGLTAGATISTRLLSVSSTSETYEEQNPSAVTPNGVTVGKDGEWDWAIQDNGAPVGTNYCFRMVQSTGQVLKDYVDYPQLITNNTPDPPALVAPFDNEKFASTSPWLQFTTIDDNGENIHYEVQISTDPTFATTVIDEDSVTNFSKFSNILNSADKSPFASGATVQYTPTASLTNNTTYWWRVKAKDPLGTNTYGTYSAVQSFTVVSTTTVSTWYQQKAAQFTEDTFVNLTTVGDTVQLSGANTTGTLYTPLIDYAQHTSGNSWGTVSFNNTVSAGNTILYHVEYFTSTSSWAIVPDSDLSGNTAGTTSPISLTTLDPGTYEFLRVRADFTKTSTTPVLNNLTVSWALSVAAPTLLTPFDNEKNATTTPTFTFTTTDPQGDNLKYQIQWSTDANFVTGVTARTSDLNPTEFADVSSTTATTPFPSGDTISYTVPVSLRLASSTTYWWRVKALDPGGGAAYSLYSNSQSFTPDTTVQQSTWFQTTNDQFTNDTLVLTGASGGDVTATSTTGNIAIFASNALAGAITTTVFNNGWDNTVRSDGVYGLSGTTTINLAKGYYAALYGMRFQSTSGTAASKVQSGLNVGGVLQPTGWSSAFVRHNTAPTPPTEGYTFGGGVIKVTSNNTPLIVQSFRTDINAGTMIREATTSGLMLVKLDDAWNYLRLHKTNKQTGPVSSSWVTVTYDTEDQVDTTAFTHPTGSGNITLQGIGHYLVFANTYGALKTVNQTTDVIQKLTLNGTDVEGSFTTVNIGGAAADGDYEGAASIGMIIQSTSTNSVLNVRLARSIGTSAWTIDSNKSGAYVNRTALTIVKIPEADFIRLTQSNNNNNINPTLATAYTWNTEAEKDTSFITHSTTTNPSRINTTIAGDYLFLASQYAATSSVSLAEYFQGWRKTAAAPTIFYGQTGGYSNTTVSANGNWSGIIMPGMGTSDYAEVYNLAIGVTANMFASHKGMQGVRIASLSEADLNPKTIQSADITFSSGSGPKWSSFAWSDVQPGGTSILYQLYYFDTASSTYKLVPNAAFGTTFDNTVGTTTSPIDISNVDRTTYSTLRTQATFTCSGGTCPTLHDWTVKWSLGVNVSGTAKAFDQTTNITSGTVFVAVNGTLQAGKTGTISGGTWTISNVVAFTNDIITVFVGTSTASAKAVAITKYTTSGDITGMKLYQNHVTLGSADNPTLTNTDLSKFDDGKAAAQGHTAEVFDDVTGGNLTVCNVAGCSGARLLIQSGTTYEPSVAGSGNVTTPNIQIDGTFIADSNTVTVSGSWLNNSVFTKGTSSVVFSATSTSETVNSTFASSTSYAFYNVTFGASGAATWSLQSPLVASGTLAVNFGMLKNATNTLTLSGNLTIGVSGTFTAGTGSTTFTGSATSVWTDNTVSKQDMGTVIVGGTSKTVQLGGAVKATTLTINSGSTLDVTSSNYGITISGNWVNNGTFTAQSGTVTFVATTTGFTISTGGSNFYNLAFNGVGGNWAFTTNTVTTNNNFTIATGTVTLPTATTTIGGSFDASTGTFSHNVAAVVFNGSGSRTINPGASSFNDLWFTGSGSYTFTGANATTSRTTLISSGTVTMPSGTYNAGGSFLNNGGAVTHNSGTLKFTGSVAQSAKLNGSSMYNLLVTGSNIVTFTDTNDTAVNNVTFQSGTTTLPSGTFTVGGSFISTGGGFTNNSGTVLFNSGVTGNVVTPGTSSFNNVTFDNPSGGWTVTQSATSTGNFTLNNASSFALASSTTFAVGSVFTNGVGGAATSFGSSTLALTSGTSYSINTKTTGGDVYGNLVLGAGTNIRMWGSSAIVPSLNATASLYSQNHAGTSGTLNIYGAYTRSSGSDYWDYATDFDGTALGVGSRAVSVNIANSSTVNFTGGTLEMLGSASATTTVQNQGVGTYTFIVNGANLNAQYYQIGSTTPLGLTLQGATTIASLANGSFILSIPSGGSSITASSTVIDRNALLQIQQVKFATTTGVNTGFNVTETGVPTSTANFWWFRNAYGINAGEAHNNDAGGNPGYIHWDDSGYNISVSGHIYADHGNTVIGNPPCDGTADINLFVGSNTYTTSCNAGTGLYTFPSVQFTGDQVMAVFISTATSKKAVTLTKTPTANISNFDLYQNALVVRHEGVTPVSIADLAVFDSSKNANIFYSASTSTNTFILQPANELYLWTGMTFIPGGNITLQSGGNGTATDGRMFMATSSTFTAAGTQAHSIGGGLFVQSGATFTAANSTVTFVATTTGKSIFSANPLTLYNAVFNGSGGQWSVDSATGNTLIIQNGLTLTAGTIVGTGDVTLQAGSLTGGGTITMTGGTFTIASTGNFGNSNPWQFKNLTLGNGVTVASTTKTGSATTTITGVLTVTANQMLFAGNSPWALSGSGTPFVQNGTFTVQSAPFTYSGTSATNVTFTNSTNYASLTLAPSGAGSPTYTTDGGTPSIGNLTIGNGVNNVTVNANSGAPSINLNGDMTINTNAAYVASTGSLFVTGSWTNNGTFTNSSATVTFTATTTGKTINPGASNFYNTTFNSATGGWTIVSNATSTNNLLLTSAAVFTVNPNIVLNVGGTFTNSVGGAATTFDTSTLSLTSGTSYTLNTKTTGGDTYGTLAIAASTNIRMWNSSAATTSVNTSGSLYSMNHANVLGALNIWGAYSRSSGSDYWSYATDFDGTDISASPRKVNVSIASSSVLTYSGGVFNIIGGATASTTVTNQGAGAYSLAVSGGTFSAQYYELRNMDSSGLNLSGTPTIQGLSNGDFQLSIPTGGTMMTVNHTVIDLPANQLLLSSFNKFATTSGVISGNNVTEVGTSVSAWKFDKHYGNLAGEAFDNDPAGDPGYIIWNDSANQITVSGKVYSDEGVTPSALSCDGVTANVKLVVQGGTQYTATCNHVTGAYSIPNVSYNPNDSLILYLATTTGPKAANVTKKPSTSIALDLYENRVIVRHEDVAPITITSLNVWDSSHDAAVPFTATTTSSVTLPPNTKLIVWDGKTFAPGGNVIIQSGGAANTYDGSLEVRPSGTLSAATTQSYSIGGNFALDLGATFSAANSTVTFTATTTGKTITTPVSSFYNLSFNGVGGNWAFASSSATTTNDFTIVSGSVTLPTNFLYVGGSFLNTGGSFAHNNGTLFVNATVAGKNIRVGVSPLANLIASTTGSGTWSFFDTIATTTSLTINSGTLTLPSDTLAVSGSFINSGGIFVNNNGTIKFTSTASGKSVQAGGSDFYKLLFSGAGGSWTFLDVNATSSDFTIAAGTTTMPTGTFATNGSLVNLGGGFTANNGTIKFVATTTGKTISPGSSNFYNVLFDGAAGGWTLTQNATSTNNFTLTNAAAFTFSPNNTLSVGGTFTNLVGGAATTWATTTLSLVSGTSYTLNTKTAGGDVYGTLVLASSTNIRMWGSSAATTTVPLTASLYSMNHSLSNGTAQNGMLYIYGAYTRSSGTDYWNYTTDFDGTALGGSPRVVNVQIASSSIIKLSGGALNIVGNSGATTTISNQGNGAYTFAVSGGIFNAVFYSVRNTDGNGLAFTNTPSITSLDYGDFQLSQLSGSAAITLAGSVVDANASFRITGDRFATSSGVTSGSNVYLSSATTNAWTFAGAYGNYAGEAFDGNDGITACGQIRWDDSSCLFVNQAHYRWRNDDGGEGALASAWYNASWTARKKVAITNPNAGALTSYPVKLTVPYDAAMNSNFSDLRFTDSSGTTSLSYYVESYTASATSTVWVNVPSLPGSGSATIYMYYGNAAATDASNGSNTFSFFEDFESSAVSGYTGTAPDKALFQIASSFNHNGSKGLSAATVGGRTAGGIYKTGSQTAQGNTIRYFQYVDATAGSGFGNDEPCTLFGVTGSGSNYGVCMEEFNPAGGPYLSLVKNAISSSNDGSAVVLATTSVTYVTGWYEVSIDWLFGNNFNISVYNPNGSLFTSLNKTVATTSTSGGYGFSFWTQHGGWDYYTVRPYAASAPTAIFGTKQGNNGATWAAAEDTGVVGLFTGQNIRLRFSVQNTGSPLAGDAFQLWVAPKGSFLNCESVNTGYAPVPVAGSCGTSASCMTSSSQFTNLASTSPSLTYPANMSFNAGEMVQNSTNLTNTSVPVAFNAATELEYNFQMTSFATDNAYCFRVNKGSTGGLNLDSYDHVAQATISHAPTFGSIFFNGSNDIFLTEGTTTTIQASSTITDLNGYADILAATSTFFRSGPGMSAACAASDSNCYRIATSSCLLTGCAGNSCLLTCSANIQYFADPTDSPNLYGGTTQHWYAAMSMVDSTNLYATSTSGLVDVRTLFGLTINVGAISFGSLQNNQDTGSTNATTTVANTGNTPIDIQIAGTALSNSSGSIATSSQKYATSTFQYASCSLCGVLSGAATNVGVNITQATSTATTTQNQKNVYWGITIPNGTPATAAAYQGVNTFTAVMPSP
jgi:hypothetical protein